MFHFAWFIWNQFVVFYYHSQSDMMSNNYEFGLSQSPIDKKVTRNDSSSFCNQVISNQSVSTIYLEQTGSLGKHSRRSLSLQVFIAPHNFSLPDFVI